MSIYLSTWLLCKEMAIRNKEIIEIIEKVVSLWFKVMCIRNLCWSFGLKVSNTWLCFTPALTVSAQILL